MERLTNVLQSGTVHSEPTKSFFVEMLTRDIELIDAIMDLVDNCIDGVHRSINDDVGRKSSAKPYEGYWAELALHKEQFLIKDNCGGMSLDIAINNAFKFGRDLREKKRDENIETVGMYGIGMKRAIFKMGYEAEVVSRHEEDKFIVSIPPDWLSIEPWPFPYQTITDTQADNILVENGLSLSIKQLREPIASQFENGVFLRELFKKLNQHYGYIISKGFTIKINGSEVPPLEIELLKSESPSKKGINPFVYVGKLDDVDVSVVVGFYTIPAQESDIDDALEGIKADSKSETAGITVLCNERVVLYTDKSYLTGWGDTGIPKYHTQFINIAGVVHFRSKDPYKLPVTTTKRYLDTSSLIYFQTKIKIKEGLKLFTQFTNKWKQKSNERDELFKDAKQIKVLQPITANDSRFTFKEVKKYNDGFYQIPELPLPNDEFKQLNVSISFIKERIKVEKLAEYYFRDRKKSAAEVGSFCFEEMYLRMENE